MPFLNLPCNTSPLPVVHLAPDTVSRPEPLINYNSLNREMRNFFSYCSPHYRVKGIHSHVCIEKKKPTQDEFESGLYDIPLLVQHVSLGAISKEDLSRVKGIVHGQRE